MGWWERVRAALGREARDARDAGRHVAQKLDTELGRRERELSASPEQRLDTTLEQIAASDQEFDELSRTIRQPQAEAAPSVPPDQIGQDGLEGDARSSPT